MAFELGDEGQYQLAVEPVLVQPVTKKNWEHTGVKPDIASPAADALKVAYAAILRAQLAAEKDADEQGALKALIADVEAGKPEVPNYAPPNR